MWGGGAEGHLLKAPQVGAGLAGARSELQGK